MNRNLNRRIHPIAEADGLSPKKPRKKKKIYEFFIFVSLLFFLSLYKKDETG